MTERDQRGTASRREHFCALGSRRRFGLFTSLASLLACAAGCAGPKQTYYVFTEEQGNARPWVWWPDRSLSPLEGWEYRETDREGFPGDIDQIEQDCAAGDQQLCVGLGVLLRQGQEVERDLPRAAVLFGRACNEGYARACHFLATLHEEGKGVDQDAEEADRLNRRTRALLRTGCDAGDLTACLDLARVLEEGVGGDKDQRTALTLWERGCGAGHAKPCLHAGSGYERPNTDYSNLAKARELYGLLCDRDNAHGCVRLAIVWDRDDDGSADIARARSAMDKANRLGLHSVPCMVAGMVEFGVGSVPDPDRARELYRQACDSHDTCGCLNLGRLLEGGFGSDKNLGEARASYERAFPMPYQYSCRAFADNLIWVDKKRWYKSKKLGFVHQQICRPTFRSGTMSRLGDMWLDEKISPPDPVMAQAWFERACETRDSPDSCVRAGKLMLEHSDALHFKLLALELFGQACSQELQAGCDERDQLLGVLSRSCQGGDSEICRKLGQTYDTASAGIDDFEKAIGLYIKACRGGDIEACELALPMPRRCPGVPGCRYDPAHSRSEDIPKALKYIPSTCEGPNREPCEREHAALDRCKARIAFQDQWLPILRSEKPAGGEPLVAAMRTLEIACEQGNGSACSALASLLEPECEQCPDALMDKEYAELKRRECEEGHHDSCLCRACKGDEKRRLGLTRQYRLRACRLGFERGCGSPDGYEDTEMLDAMQHACDSGADDICLSLASTIVGNATDDDRIARGEALGRKIWDKTEAGCEAGSAEACYRLGMIYGGWIGSSVVRSDQWKARGMYARACESGMADACLWAGQAFREESGRFDKQAKALLRKACESGVKHACVLMVTPDGRRHEGRMSYSD